MTRDGGRSQAGLVAGKRPLPMACAAIAVLLFAGLDAPALPTPGADVPAQAAAGMPALGAPDFKPSADRPVGWRGDGSGCFPGATPPVRWSEDQGLVWKTPLPTWSNSSVILVEDRIFVCAEPDALVCLDARDGQILWQRTNDYREGMSPQEQALAREETEKDRRLEREWFRVKDEMAAAAAKLGKEPGNAELKRLAEEKRATLNELDRERRALKHRMAPTDETCGYSTPTPVSDGSHVFVLFGSGLAACYDVQGRRKWAKFVEKPWHPLLGHSGSPVLAGHQLLVHFDALKALDASTGEVLWSVKSRKQPGTDLVAHVAGGRIVVTDNGDFIRAADGRMLAANLVRLEYCSPIVADGVAYFMQPRGKALKLPPRVAESSEPDVVWEATPELGSTPTAERHYASPLAHAGLVYMVSEHGLLRVVEAATGALVYRQKVPLRKTVYTSVTLAGDYIFLGSEGGAIGVIEPGREYREVARNEVAPFRSCPFFQGKRMYLRTLDGVCCYGE